MIRQLYQLATILLLAWVNSATSQVPKVQKLSDELSKKARTLNPEYLVFQPSTKSDRPIPMVIYLHGAGGVGDNILKIKGQAGQIFRGIGQHKKHPCIVVAPQVSRKNRQKGGWVPAHLNVLLGHLKATFKIDEKRIYLTGNSMGGYGSWTWGGHNPEHFAAIAPVSGGIGPGGPKDVSPEIDKWAKNLAKIPVYAFAGRNDRVVPAERSQRMVSAIQKAGGKKAKIKIYPNEGHAAGRNVFGGQELYDWMFAQKRQ